MQREGYHEEEAASPEVVQFNLERRRGSVHHGVRDPPASVTAQDFGFTRL